ncbi:MAG: HD domain-containing protein [Verrucomicrobiota bacterium]|nr:HD domain-containing protein [Verrucomicrobiota bacterium]
MNPTDQIRDLFSERGHLAYGEGVSELQHALQAGYLAQKDNASDNQILAALLHDIGHLLHGLPEDVAEQGIDAHHEQIGEKWLKKWFGLEISQPVGLHVTAKRYQCTVQADYLEQLSPASAKSFILQGGKMTEAEIRAFEGDPFFNEALQLRTWDDHAKDREMETPPLEHYLPLIQVALVSEGSNQ